MNSSALAGLFASCVILASTPAAHGEDDWAKKVAFPQSEKPVELFNGRDISGWDGQVAKYWSVEKGILRGANETEVPANTYGLQLHGNSRPQEFHFRGLILAENPGDRLLTLKSEVK